MAPNIFNLATSELSHDAFFTWLLQWADPRYSILNYEVHDLGKAFLKLVLDDKYAEDIDHLQSVKADRQWENIDVWAEVVCKNKSILLILENKTYSAEHSDQLIRYKKTGEQFCNENNFELSCAYVKIGSETQKTIRAIKEKGYKTISRLDLLDLITVKEYKHPLVQDYLNFIQQLEDDQNEYKNKFIREWNGACWVGFYQYLESTIPVNMWHFVNNPSGGFWNLSLNWKYWNDIPVYTQIEEGKITFKVALSEEETGLTETDIDINGVQDFIHKELIDFSNQYGFKSVIRPQYMTHRGSYRAVGVVMKESWMGDLDKAVNLEKCVKFLTDLQTFYDHFIEHMRKSSYDKYFYNRS